MSARNIENDGTARSIKDTVANLEKYINRSPQNALELTIDMFDETASLGRSVEYARRARLQRSYATPHYMSLRDHLEFIAMDAMESLLHYGVENFEDAFIAEYERAAVKHPGMTLDADAHTDETRFYALAEEVGEVAASLTYDNTNSTGHNADTIAEVTQVGALALAWLARYQDGEER